MYLRSLCVAVGLLVPVQALRAAELRITFDELTKLVQTIAAETKIYLNSVPGLFSTQSYVQIGGQTYQLQQPLQKAITKAGYTYVYSVREMTSTSVRVTPVSSALRLTINFKTDGPVAVPSCPSGDCPFLDSLPDIYWAAPVVNVDLVPIRFNGSISMQVDKVSIGGVPRAQCGASAGLFCNVFLALARKSIASLKTSIPKSIKDALNDANVQQRMADGLKAYLTVGQSGAVAINAVSVAPNTMTVNFRFNQNGAGK
jgi:hypothetical protein